MQLRVREGLHGRCEGERTSLVEVKIRECWSSLVGRASHEFGTVRESREGCLEATDYMGKERLTDCW